MKKQILLITDIHGNLPALEAILEEVKDIHFEAILCNGDIIYGSKPNQCLEKLLDLNAVMIAGNIETDVIRLKAKLCPPDWYECDQYAFKRQIADKITQKNLLELYKLSKNLIITDLLPGSILMVHGSPDSQTELLFPQNNNRRFEEIMESNEQDFIIFGHTHNQWDRKYGNKWAINAGSVGMPLDGNPNTQYTIISYEEGNKKSVEIDHRSIPYNYHQTIKDFQTEGFDITHPNIKHVFHLLRTGRKRELFFRDYYFELAETQSGKKFEQLTISQKNNYWDIANKTYEW